MATPLRFGSPNEGTDNSDPDSPTSPQSPDFRNRAIQPYKSIERPGFGNTFHMRPQSAPSSSGGRLSINELTPVSYLPLAYSAPRIEEIFPPSRYDNGRLIVSPSKYKIQFQGQGLPVTEADYQRGLRAPVARLQSSAKITFDTYRRKWDVEFPRPYPCFQLPFTSYRPKIQPLNQLTNRKNSYTETTLSIYMKIRPQTLRVLMETINQYIFSGDESTTAVIPEEWTYLKESAMGIAICKRLSHIRFPRKAVDAVLKGANAGFTHDTMADEIPQLWEMKYIAGYYMYQAYLICKERHEQRVARASRNIIGGGEDGMASMLQQLSSIVAEKNDIKISDAEEAPKTLKSQFPAHKLHQELKQFETVVLRDQLGELSGVTETEHMTLEEAFAGIGKSVAEHDVLMAKQKEKSEDQQQVNEEQRKVNEYQTDLCKKILAGIQENNMGITKLYQLYCLDRAEIKRLTEDIRDLRNARI